MKLNDPIESELIGCWKPFLTFEFLYKQGLEIDAREGKVCVCPCFQLCINT